MDDDSVHSGLTTVSQFVPSFFFSSVCNTDSLHLFWNNFLFNSFNTGSLPLVCYPCPFQLLQYRQPTSSLLSMSFSTPAIPAAYLYSAIQVIFNSCNTGSLPLFCYPCPFLLLAAIPAAYLYSAIHVLFIS